MGHVHEVPGPVGRQRIQGLDAGADRVGHHARRRVVELGLGEHHAHPERARPGDQLREVPRVGLLVLALDGELDEAEGLDTGADDYLTKPFAFPVLLARVRSLVRRAARRDPVPQLTGLLSVDSIARRVFVDGVEVEVTRREFDVLEYLARRPQQAVAKDEIVSGVWGFDFAGDPNIVEVYIARLRRKLAAPRGTNHIVTVRGVGYRIDGGDG